MLDAQEMRRRWSDKTVADKDSFLTSGYRTDFVYGPSSRELEIDFAHCRSIVFMDGDSTRGEDVLLIVKGSGHVTLPPGVQVRVSEGSVKLSAASAPPGQSVIGAGYRAPPPTRVSGYAGSSVSSGSASAYRTAPSEMRPRNPSPPSSSASFRAGGSHVGTYVRASRVPLPESRVGGRMEEEEDWDIDTRSVAPSDSVSSVGMKRERERSLRGGFY